MKSNTKPLPHVHVYEDTYVAENMCPYTAVYATSKFIPSPYIYINIYRERERGWEGEGEGEKERERNDISLIISTFLSLSLSLLLPLPPTLSLLFNNQAQEC
jgi:hypothetical protein